MFLKIFIHRPAVNYTGTTQQHETTNACELNFTLNLGSRTKQKQGNSGLRHAKTLLHFKKYK